MEAGFYLLPGITQQSDHFSALNLHLDEISCIKKGKHDTKAYKLQEYISEDVFSCYFAFENEKTLNGGIQNTELDLSQILIKQYGP